MPSTAIEDIDYDPETRILSVTFVPTGQRYIYADVPADLVEEFRSAFSKGRFFNLRIRDQFPYAPVGQPKG